MSAISNEVCERIIQTGLNCDMSTNLSRVTLSAASPSDPQSSAKTDFVQSHEAILRNVLTKNAASRYAFRDCQAADIEQKFSNIADHPVLFTNCLTINFVPHFTVKQT